MKLDKVRWSKEQPTDSIAFGETGTAGGKRKVLSHPYPLLVVYGRNIVQFCSVLSAGDQM